MAGTRSIESYVEDVCKYIDKWDYKNMNKVYETLQKMKSSFKTKHFLNYWKVLQCIGEVAADKLIYMVVKSPKASCQKHTICHLLHVMELFSECLTTVALIKRVNSYKDEILPVVFLALEQREFPELVRKGFIVLYRMIIVGKSSLVVPYMKHGIVRHMYQQIKCRQGAFGIYCLEAVSYCAKILAALLQLGDKDTRRTISKSNVINELDVYAVKLQKSKVDWDGVEDVFEYHDRVRMLCIDDSLTSSLKPEDWNPKEKLLEELEQFYEVYIFCSSPACRKLETEKEKFLYCGKCRLSRYCSPECQKEHWKQGHKEMCLHDYGPDL
ncbi:uncharacterized protein LOC134229280 [Saccostrea cucullata]|uniref:uncharacterized protein LOC134229280 n=1 Tax=Saccostrea cuccullata TaxID=36930 RepID=UPI002ED3335D